jgi:predicted GIY-YIG superfamily endonuclease
MNTNYLYFARIGPPALRLYKIGTTNNIPRRIREHRRTYRQPIEILWVSKPYSKYTTLRVEEQTISAWKKLDGFQYIRNDRFIISPTIHQVKIKVRKEWTVDL